ncbi:MAG: Chorismate mutase AroH [Firmicutes bacterium ADurb.Bin419]|nr:MAG: Chorismate mutase AroH [Firmicutes bacterium ADurb.Bin419]
MVRAIRGATTVENNNADEMLRETEKLLIDIVEKNRLKEEDIISIIFTVTNDLNATFPAIAARNLGWTSIALMCTNEINVPGSLEKCIRVLIHVNSDKNNNEIKHVYLNKAKVLRPDL